jgi:hypothetical protein
LSDNVLEQKPPSPSTAAGSEGLRRSRTAGIDLGAKKIHNYRHMKVIFMNGKDSDVQ